MQSRREFIVNASVAATAASLGITGVAPAKGVSSELCNLSAGAAVHAMQSGDIAAESYASALLARCEDYKDLGAFISIEPHAVLEAARDADKHRRRGKPLGVLHGLPVPVKDSVNSRTLPTSAGTEALRNFRPTSNAPVLQRLLDQGAILLGKTNLHELSLGYTTNNAAFGACHNPYDARRSPGGSSGGSAAAVAARLAPLAVAEDTLGSIRVPAAQCGLVGLRPSIDRYPKGGIMPITPRFDTPGAVARSVADLILFDGACQPQKDAARAPSLTGIRLGVPGYQWSELDSETERVCRNALDRLKDSGAILIFADVPVIVREAWTIASAIIASEVVANETAYLAQFDPQLSFADFEKKISAPLRNRFDTAFIAGTPGALRPDEYRERVDQLAQIHSAIVTYLNDNQFAATVFPTTLTSALPIGVDGDTDVAGHTLSVRLAMARNVAGATCAGIPGLSLPAGLTANGLPVGLEFDAGYGEDANLLQLGLALERALGPITPPRSAS